MIDCHSCVKIYRIAQSFHPSTFVRSFQAQEPRSRTNLWFIGRKRAEVEKRGQSARALAPMLKKVDTLTPFGVVARGSRPGVQHVDRCSAPPVGSSHHRPIATIPLSLWYRD